MSGHLRAMGTLGYVLGPRFRGGRHIAPAGGGPA